MKKYKLIGLAVAIVCLGFVLLLNSKDKENINLPSQVSSEVKPQIPVQSQITPINEPPVQKSNTEIFNDIKAPDLKGKKFAAALKEYFSKVPKEMLSRVSAEAHEFNTESVWIHLTLDGIPVEMTEARLVLEEGKEIYKIQTGGLVEFPVTKLIYKSLSQDQINSVIGNAELVGSPKKIWEYKPGLLPKPVVDIKVKTATSTHSGEILRVDTLSGKIIKKYQSVRN